MRGRGILLLALAACGGDAEDPLRFGVTLEVVDDSGAPVAGATIDLGSAAVETDGAGRAELRGLTGPVMAIVSHDALLDEPVAVGRDDAGTVVPVRTWRREGGRWSFHSGGDVMLGRRYNAPPEGDPLIDRATAASDAVAIVEPVRRAFTASDARTFNLETVVADLPDDAAYPGKRFILQTWPETLAGVHALSPTVVISANNHGRDYLDEGVSSTQAALAAEGLDFIGVTDGSGPALEPATFDVEGRRVGVLAWTTVDGAFVNDSYPEDGEPIPADVQDVDLWQYSPRTWGWTGTGGSIATADRRIGSAWRAFEALEPDLSDDEVADLWASMTTVYPEMQDWVARRGHGGAAKWVTSEATAMITSLAAETDVVVVQLHAGFQFQPAPSDYVRQIAHEAIDAGADLVVCHHPHVLQGVEYYKGKLIAFSLGNFIFDQDFLSTFASGFLRTIWEGDRLLEARLVPIEIAAYRPTPVADDAARRSLLRVWEMSTLRASASRGADNGIRVFTAELDADTAPAPADRAPLRRLHADATRRRDPRRRRRARRDRGAARRRPRRPAPRPRARRPRPLHRPRHLRMGRLRGPPRRRHRRSAHPLDPRG